MVSGDTVYQITYYASDVYMLQKTGFIYIYININKNYFKPITFFIVLGGVGNVPYIEQKSILLNVTKIISTNDHVKNMTLFNIF